MQAQMEKELADVPEWKREIMMKKGAAPTNWGDEREDINRDEEDGEENQNYEWHNSRYIGHILFLYKSSVISAQWEGSLQKDNGTLSIVSTICQPVTRTQEKGGG